MNQHPEYLLNTIEEPKDIKKLSLIQLQQLATEMRQLVLEKDAAIGGHVGPNLGIMETTLAFHYVFDSPKDKIVWDVSHQAYGHKMLTGRKLGFLDPQQYDAVSGYTSPDESCHDFFTIGHTSTSVSLAVGLAKARDLLGAKENIVALIGDGSLSGGMAFEGLSNGATLNSNFIVIINDNQMSIDENKGGIYQGLARLRETNGTDPNNPFIAMGYDYHYVADGNDLAAMIEVFQTVKDIDHPVILHINTLKGKGYRLAEENQMAYHWRGAFDLQTGELKNKTTTQTYDDIILAELDRQIIARKPIVAITAAIPGAFKLKEFEAKHPDNYLDVGIAEQHSITFATGLAKRGARPVVFQNSTFLQRAYDQLSHDMALNEQPVVIIVQGGINGGSRTHLGMFDIPYLTSIPNIEYLAPTSKEELVAMLRWALTQTNKPVVIRKPNGPVVSRSNMQTDFSTITYHIAQKGKKVAFLGLGDFFDLAVETGKLLETKLGIKPTIINPTSAATLDQTTLEHLKDNHDLVVTLENGSLEGGFGQKIAQYYATSDLKVCALGAKKQFTDCSQHDLFIKNHLTSELIISDLKKVLQLN